MYRSEEEACQEGIRLLEAHVKLLREARATLRCQSTTSIDGNTNNQEESEDRLQNEIEKVEEKIKTWQNVYEDVYLQGNSIWDIIRKEVAEQTKDIKQEMEEEEEEAEKKEREISEMMTENHSKELRDNKKCNKENIIHEKIEDKEGKEDNEEQIAEEKEQKIICNKRFEINKNLEEVNEKEIGKETINQELDMKLIEKTVKQTLLPAEDNGRSTKRQLKETDEKEEESVKRRRVVSPDGPLKRLEGYKVLVQNLPLTIEYNDLRNYFMKFGTVNRVFLKAGSGCGFVTYQSEEIVDLVCSLEHRVCDHDVKVVRDTFVTTPLPGPESRNQDLEVFVFGLPCGIEAQEQIHSALAIFGPVVSVKQHSKKNYAFVRFETESCKEAAVKARTVTINNKQLNIRRTASKEEAAKEATVTSREYSKKGYQVFLFGVSAPLDFQGFKLALSKFGTVVSVYMPEDKNYAFVGFETEDSQRAALEAGTVNLPYGRAFIKSVTRK